MSGETEDAHRRTEEQFTYLGNVIAEDDLICIICVFYSRVMKE